MDVLREILDIECDALIESLDIDVIEAHLFQLLDGDVVIDRRVVFLDLDVGSELKSRCSSIAVL